MTNDSMEHIAIPHECTLICKYGFDGSAGHSQYKQKWTRDELNDEYLFASPLVPLHLKSNISGNFLWSNPCPSSVRYCRPIRLQWAKESKKLSIEEEKYIERQIKTLKNLEIEKFSVKFCMVLTMIDGKVCNALTNASSMKCYICGARISEMNNLENLRTTISTSRFSFGLSPLHCYIRCLECLLRISYRLDIKQWKAKVSDGSKQKMQARRERIQRLFKKKMGLIIDVPKPGYGTTNDGNTARRFFSNPKLSAKITGKRV
ncbi:uncharacterized protein LOC124167721 [Ischnura elegans]|uniref:uncharacterized protein LOC124167721 n=1 Tax=Ischnura elegans TaxID=197161 RepID=UPI001ED87FE7|nr:uncharacterized protein LOC124167721 [Ischnura elegans]